MWRAVVTTMGADHAYLGDGETPRIAVELALEAMAEGDEGKADLEDVRLTVPEDAEWRELRRVSAPPDAPILQIVDTGHKMPYGLGFCFRLP